MEEIPNISKESRELLYNKLPELMQKMILLKEKILTDSEIDKNISDTLLYLKEVRDFLIQKGKIEDSNKLKNILDLIKLN